MKAGEHRGNRGALLYGCVPRVVPRGVEYRLMDALNDEWSCTMKTAPSGITFR